MDTIRFEPNQPQVIALAFSEGKSVDSKFGGTQVMFSTVDGRIMYVAPIVAAKIKAAGVQARQPFELVKVQQGNTVEWKVRTQNAATDVLQAPAAALGSVDRLANRTPPPYRDQALDATYRAMERPAQPENGRRMPQPIVAAMEQPRAARPDRQLSAMAARIVASYTVAFEVVAALEQATQDLGYTTLDFAQEDFIVRIAATAFIEANKADR